MCLPRLSLLKSIVFQNQLYFQLINVPDSDDPISAVVIGGAVVNRYPVNGAKSSVGITGQV